jgi:PKD repeat protein
MQYEEYSYDVESEARPARRRAMWIIGGLAGAILLACACVLCLVLSFLIGYNIKKATMTVPPPTVEILPEPVIVQPAEARVGEEIVFDGSGSQAGSSPIAGYEWDFGDGNRGDGPIVSHIYSAPGTYQVTLTVTDQDGRGSTGGPAQIVITGAEPTQPAPTPTPAESQAPQPIVSSPAEGLVGEPITFDGSGSQAGSSPIASYQWSFGDGNRGDGAVVTHAYQLTGTYQVVLTVIGQDGLANTSAPVPIVIQQGAQPPPGAGELPEAIMVFPSEAFVNEAVGFDGSESRPGSSVIMTYMWDWGDGTTGSGIMVTHTYETVGEFMVTLTVVDQAGQTNTTDPRPITITE